MSEDESEGSEPEYVTECSLQDGQWESDSGKNISLHECYMFCFNLRPCYLCQYMFLLHLSSKNVLI